MKIDIFRSMLVFFFFTSLNAEDFREVAKKAIPAVVSIKVKGGEHEILYDPFGDGLFGQFFQIPQGPVSSQGSGFLVSSDGYIMTNNHVVKDHGEITVTLNDGRDFKGKIIGEDPMTDLALVKIEAEGLPFLEFGNSDDLEVGQWVAAIGNPLGLQATFTVGVVSAKGRNNLDLARIEDFIQTDAALNQGNSGGPLLDLNAKVIGINTAIATNMMSKGYGFAIPSQMAKTVYGQLEQTGQVERGFLGIVLQKMDAEMALALDLKSDSGAIVASVQSGSSAEKAGIKTGDILLEYNGKPLANVAKFKNYIAMLPPKTKLNLSLLRDKKVVALSMEIGTFKEEIQANNTLGIKVEKDPSITEGLIVKEIYPKSIGQKAGLKKGAVILSVNQKPVSSVDDFNKILSEHDKQKPLLLHVKMGDLTQFILIRM